MASDLTVWVYITLPGKEAIKVKIRIRREESMIYALEIASAPSCALPFYYKLKPVGSGTLMLDIELIPML